ncbi:MAG: GGDEF domain-containing protein [Clostridiales bacterium]|nr:GGDEF domain-containing protein [Clostridiales bacterium]
MGRRLLADLNLVICVILAGFLVLLFSDKLNGGNVSAKVQPFADGWYYEDGTEVDFTDLRTDEASITITKLVSPGEVRGRDLCFETSNLFFEVYLNDVLTYEFHPDLLEIYGKYYGDYTHTVDLSIFANSTELKIVYQPLISNSWTTFRGMELQEGAAFFQSVIADKFIQFLSSFTIMIIGITLVIMGLLLNKDTDRIVETVSLGTVAIDLAIWTSSGSRVLQLISGNSAVIRVLDHLTLMWLPVPVILFVASVTGLLKSKITYINLILVGINTVAVFLLVPFKICDYHDLLIYTHIRIGLGILSIIYMITVYIRRSRMVDKSMKYMLGAFGLLVCSGLMDGVRYYLIDSKDASLITRIGLFVFVIVLTGYELSNFMEINRKSAEAEAMDRLAHNDGLTGLLNRLAFTEAESSIKASETGKYVVVQLDINYLKKVNDNYGHAEGDRFIIDAANIIDRSFGKYGKCYRIGGDEFFVIIEGEASEKDYEKGLKLFEEEVHGYNEVRDFPIPMQIAYGKSVYVPGKDSFEDAEKNADQLMYEKKKNLKAGGLYD